MLIASAATRPRLRHDQTTLARAPPGRYPRETTAGGELDFGGSTRNLCPAALYRRAHAAQFGDEKY